MQPRVKCGQLAQNLVASFFQGREEVAAVTTAANHTREPDVVVTYKDGRIKQFEVKNRKTSKSSIAIISFTISADRSPIESQLLFKVFTTGAATDITGLMAEGYVPKAEDGCRFHTMNLTDQVSLKWLQTVITEYLIERGNTDFAIVTASNNTIRMYDLTQDLLPVPIKAQIGTYGAAKPGALRLALKVVW